MSLEAQTPSSSVLPVGAIIAFAGGLSPLPEGWVVCDGTPYAQSALPELYSAIGSSFGSTPAPNPTFSVPQLCGAFPRHTAATGSFATSKPYSTALPTIPFVQSCDNLGGEMHHYETGKNEGTPCYNNNDSRTLTVAAGGDLESRPKNKYVAYLIKTASLTSGGLAVLPPVGCVIAYAGVPGQTGQYWTLADGRSEPTNGQFAALFTAIGYSHGGASDGQMVLPDYRGYFLRGVDNGAGLDPNANSRTAPYQGAQAGNAGDAVGSVQGMATGLPTTTPFTLGIPEEPLGYNSKAKEDKAGTGVIGGYSGQVIDLTTPQGAGGGDLETAPQNYAVDFYVGTRASQNPSYDNIPVGSVVVFAVASTTEIPGYLVCDGALYPQSANEALFNAIQNLYGGDATNFNVPDYRGYFLRGNDPTGTVDVSKRAPCPAKGVVTPKGFGNVGTVQTFSTALPSTQFQGTVSLANDTTDILVGGGNQTMQSQTSGLSPWGGGDTETAPVHVNLTFYIKASL